MQRVFRVFLFWILILCACTTNISSTQSLPPTLTLTPLTFPTAIVPTPEVIVTLGTPDIDQPPDGNIPTTAPNPQDCGYQWANQDLPELSSSFQESIQTLQPEAQASAYAFGENCMLSDGSVGGFGAMETDFNISLQISDLTNESDLGGWIVKVMQVIMAIPKEQIVGPQPGRVSIIFQSNGDQKAVNFSINQYQALTPGLNTAEIYQALQVPE
jgi:hypothetical protein